MVVTGLGVRAAEVLTAQLHHGSGKAFRPRNLDLGPWRWFTFAIGVVYLLVVVVLPLLR